MSVDDEDWFQKGTPFYCVFGWVIGLTTGVIGTIGLFLEEQKGWFAFALIAGLILIAIGCLAWIAEFHLDLYEQIKDAFRFDATL